MWLWAGRGRGPQGAEEPRPPQILGEDGVDTVVGQGGGGGRLREEEALDLILQVWGI